MKIKFIVDNSKLDYRPLLVTKNRSYINMNLIVEKLNIDINEYKKILIKYRALNDENYYYFETKQNCINFINSQEIKELLENINN